MNQESLSTSDNLASKPKRAKLTKDPNAPRKPRKLSVMQQTIIKHVTGMAGNFNPSAWKEQAKIYSSLAKKYGPVFLLWVTPPEGYKVLSLSFYHSAMGKNHLSDQAVEYAKFNGVVSERKEEVSLSQAKIGEDITVESAPKTLKDFLNYGQKIRLASISNASPPSQ